jgi:TetR/AcrR family transcriptional regulator, regulator of autoinduction and epiphytic fitness
VGETSVTTGQTGPRSPGTTGSDDAPAPVDGRLTRAARTRASVVDALLTLNDQGHLRPTARDIAAEAGVSLRSLYVHFDDLEALFVAAGHRHAERLTEVLPPMVTEGDLVTRLDAFLTRRVCIHEFGAGVRRAAVLQAPFSPVLQQALSNGRQALRAEVKVSFAPELAAAAAVDATARERLLSGLDIVTNTSTWESLRVHQEMSVDDATEHVRDMVLTFIHVWAPAATGSPATATTASADDPQG